MDGLSGSVERLNLGDAPEAGALAAAVASAAVGATSSPASASGFSKAVDDSSANNQGGSQTPGAGPAAHDKDNDVEGKLFIGGISWQTTEEGLRCGIVASRSPFLSLASDFVSAVCLARYGCRGFALPLSLGVVGFEESSCLVGCFFYCVCICVFLLLPAPRPFFELYFFVSQLEEPSVVDRDSHDAFRCPAMCTQTSFWEVWHAGGHRADEGQVHGTPQGFRLHQVRGFDRYGS